MRKWADGPLCRATVIVAVALIDIISRWNNMPFPQLSIPGSAAIPIGVRRLRSLREPSSHQSRSCAALPISRSVAKTLNGPSIPSAAVAIFSTADLSIARPAFLQRVLAVASRLFCSAFANFTTQKEGLNTMRNRICRRSSTECTTIATDFSLSGALFCVSDRRHALGQKRPSCPDKSTHAAGPNLK